MSTKRLAMILSCGLILLGAVIDGVPAQTGSNVAATKHNLNASGPGQVKVGGGRNVCSFCHTPHAANPIAPLWNRHDPGIYYQTYDSSTLVANVGQPTGASRLCLSCHDGTIALAQTFNSLNTPGGTEVFLATGDRGYLGTDLSDDHPISFVYSSSLALQKGELRDPATLPTQLPLDHEDRLQCTTCHNAHDDRYGKFLRMDNSQSKLCTSCHNVGGWTNAAHATSTANLGDSTTDQWANLSAATVRDAVCESCHRPHSAGGRQRLLRHEPEENNCLNCHNGKVAKTDLTAAIAQVSAHKVQSKTGVHDPTEDPATMNMHAECADCHDPHRANQVGTARAPDIKPSMQGASGLTRSGQTISEADYEYQVCYKCHSLRNFATPVVDRFLGDNEISDEFKSTNDSFHPVETQGRSADVPSLLQDYRTTSIVYCTDCHGSDAAQNAKGPHGSRYRPLLTDNYTTGNSVGESPQAYALCYRCHSRTNILDDKSFEKHKRHIVEERTPCSVCHDPHGVQDNTRLINFDRDVVEPSIKAGSGPTFTDLGNRQGSCTLLCHGEDHDDERY